MITFSSKKSLQANLKDSYQSECCESLPEKTEVDNIFSTNKKENENGKTLTCTIKTHWQHKLDYKLTVKSHCLCPRASQW